MADWPLDRMLAIIALVLAVFAFVVGIAVTVAMDARTRGEFRFAAGCFIFSAAMLVGAIGIWGVTTEEFVLKRILISGFLFAVIGVALVEAVRWTHHRHVRAGGPEQSTAQRDKPPQTEPQPVGSIPAVQPPVHPGETKAEPKPKPSKPTLPPRDAVSSALKEIPPYEEGAPNAHSEDPSLKFRAKLTAMSKAQLAPQVTEVTRKMREYDLSWQSAFQAPPPDSPPFNLQDGKHPDVVKKYWERVNQWNEQKRQEVEKFRSTFREKFAQDILVLNELSSRFPEVGSSPQCLPIFQNTLKKGELYTCADYLDKIVRDKLD